MNYDGLTRAYWNQQSARVQRSVDQLVQRAGVAPGRVVPEAADLTLGTGRRLPMAVMFLDISNFSSRWSSTATEQANLLVILNLFFSEMTRIAEDYGGTVEKNTGDGLMAYFEDGGGTPPERGAKRAVACALTMVEAGKYLINALLKNAGVDFRISIDYGEVTVAKLGPPRRFNAIVAIGDAANFACKMLSKAAPGEIVIGDQAQKQLPAEWQRRFTVLASLDTGWVYRQSSIPYALYRYTGRWKDFA